MAKNWRPPPPWFAELDKLGKDDALLSNREIADLLGVELDAVRKALVRYEVESEIDTDRARPTKLYRVKDLRSVAKKVLAQYHGS